MEGDGAVAGAEDSTQSRARHVGRWAEKASGTERLEEWKRATSHKIPFCVRGKVRRNPEAIAREGTIARITSETLDDAKARFRRHLSVSREMSAPRTGSLLS